ncbi:hypothetical protein Q8A67_024443 [Cirrhinus molitorella]|uniref:Uncharacterized protein n=1 Tax=Cirrhinus molitorella TaxID=172907 RepID=A0AA88NYH4_9TELE|nr:hypothetical protein Q8A67_024443 [Cirrhinus molitorella]
MRNKIHRVLQCFSSTALAYELELTFRSHDLQHDQRVPRCLWHFNRAGEERCDDHREQKTVQQATRRGIRTSTGTTAWV